MQQTTEVEAALKGDVYEFVSNKADGVVFREAKRNITFNRYCGERSRWLDDATIADGYYRIVEDMFGGSETSKVEADVTTGLFVLRAFDRKLVADAVRLRFGPESRLIKAPICDVRGRSMNLMGQKLYHCLSCHATKEA